MYNIILASGSPRRKDILSQVGIPFEVRCSVKDEVTTKTLPEDIVKDLSLLKAEDILQSITTNSMVIGADTMVALDGQVLGKPKSKEDAYHMLSILQGKTHQVYTGVSILLKEKEKETKTVQFVECSEVTINPMSHEEIMRYIETGEPLDKAGSYAIQGKFALHIGKITGDYYNIVGLPIGRLYSELKKLGIMV